MPTPAPISLARLHVPSPQTHHYSGSLVLKATSNDDLALTPGLGGSGKQERSEEWAEEDGVDVGDDLDYDDEEGMIEVHEDDMMEEWVERGLDPKEFEPRILLEMWEAEDAEVSTVLCTTVCLGTSANGRFVFNMTTLQYVPQRD